MNGSTESTIWFLHYKFIQRTIVCELVLYMRASPCLVIQITVFNSFLFSYSTIGDYLVQCSSQPLEVIYVCKTAYSFEQYFMENRFSQQFLKNDTLYRALFYLMLKLFFSAARSAVAGKNYEKFSMWCRKLSSRTYVRHSEKNLLMNSSLHKFSVF